ncbi:30225_t:CDS:2, partial [Gigaspora margarita]
MSIVHFTTIKIVTSQEIDNNRNKSSEEENFFIQRRPNLLIEEIINLSNPAFVGNNNSFIENLDM